MNLAYTYTVIRGTSAAGYTVHTLAKQATFIVVNTQVNDIEISISYDGTNFGDDIPIDLAIAPLAIPISCRAFRIRSANPLLPANYWVVCYYT